MTALEYILEQLHLPQKVLVKELSVPPASVSTWVKGKVDIPEKHMPKLMEITHVNQKLIAIKDVQDKEKVLILMQIESARNPRSEKLEYLDAKYRTLTFLDEVSLYINTHGMPQMDNGVFLVNKESIEIQWANIRRLSNLLEFAKIADDKALDYLLKGMWTLLKPDEIWIEEE